MECRAYGLCGVEFSSARLLAIVIRKVLLAERQTPNARLKVALRLLSLEPDPKAPRTFAECVLATLEDTAHFFANILVFQATSDIGDWR